MTRTGRSASAGGRESSPLTGYEVIVGVCGGIAAYKVCSVVSWLVQAGSGVSVVMTRSARRFVGPITFEALSGRQVYTSQWRSGAKHDPQHLSLTEAADLILVAPATANMIAKAAAGVADDLLSTMLVSAACPIVVAPAMNPRMWSNPIVQSNVARLTEFGRTIIGPEEGWTACREVGVGRMTEPASICDLLSERLLAQNPRSGGVS